MPMFMDRHSIPGATVEDAAANHARDLTVSAKHGVRFLSYWVDAANDGVFCLVDAPDPEKLEAVHKEAHGLIPNEIISVSEDDVLRFLDRIHDPADSTEVTNPFRTILFTDLEGSTALTEEVGVSAFMVLLTEHDLILRRALVAWRGREVKHTGDGIRGCRRGRSSRTGSGSGRRSIGSRCPRPPSSPAARSGSTARRARGRARPSSAACRRRGCRAAAS